MATWKPANRSVSKRTRRRAYTEIEKDQRHGERSLAGKKCAVCGKPAEMWDHPRGYKGENSEHVRPICRSCNAKKAHTGK